eukprot:3003797-Amphidinium_carterae.1
MYEKRLAPYKSIEPTLCSLRLPQLCKFNQQARTHELMRGITTYRQSWQKLTIKKWPNEVNSNETSSHLPCVRRVPVCSKVQVCPLATASRSLRGGVGACSQQQCSLHHSTTIASVHGVDLRGSDGSVQITCC